MTNWKEEFDNEFGILHNQSNGLVHADVKEFISNLLHQDHLNLIKEVEGKKLDKVDIWQGVIIDNNMLAAGLLGGYNQAIEEVIKKLKQ